MYRLSDIKKKKVVIPLQNLSVPQLVELPSHVISCIVAVYRTIIYHTI